VTSTATGRAVNLLGRPRMDEQHGGYRMRSRKSWALLAYLLLSERAPTRRHLATLLFGEADDPLGALRWGLSEVRRALAGDATVDGDPVVLRLKPGIVVDVDVVARGVPSEALQLPSLGSELLEGLTVRGAEVFESWLLAEQRRVAAASVDILREAARDALSQGDVRGAIGYAVRLVAMTPLDEACHALLIRLYRVIGDNVAAQRQFDTCARMLSAELGALPGTEVLAALHEPPPQSTGAAHRSKETARRAALPPGREPVGAVQPTNYAQRRPLQRTAVRSPDGPHDPARQNATDLPPRRPPGADRRINAKLSTRPQQPVRS
jgi:DNA-binding SARP family transcriptional activator